ncbi:hypothetical protein BO71DRAFT_156910 [Aspergillus ellipticus CBS 707.79]|uniref:Uncharacterized protein n=1 Tax=Aspergillus ellipticus CBS 707.79 TaxID=1448320 RepID=A0A319DHT9_9EURO|nr:hypothetical protein BO71DRAFT_156910 [Aspergillus ellipticus CBS 707.79]
MEEDMSMDLHRDAGRIDHGSGIISTINVCLPSDFHWVRESRLLLLLTTVFVGVKTIVSIFCFCLSLAIQLCEYIYTASCFQSDVSSLRTSFILSREDFTFSGQGIGPESTTYDGTDSLDRQAISCLPFCQLYCDKYWPQYPALNPPQIV